MKKYVIKLKDTGSYLWNLFITPEPDFKGKFSEIEITPKKFAMTFSKKYLADAIAKALDAEVEEAE